MLLHVVESILISIHHKEDVAMETHFGSNIKILGCVVLRYFTLEKLLPRFWNSTSFQEFPTNYPYNNKEVASFRKMGFTAP